MADRLKISQTAYSDIENSKTKMNLERVREIAAIFDINPNDIISFDETSVFNNIFNENSKGFFNVKKLINESFDNERKSYLSQIETLKADVIYLKNKLDNRND